jgi:hypothetical protein
MKSAHSIKNTPTTVIANAGYERMRKSGCGYVALWLNRRLDFIEEHPLLGLIYERVPYNSKGLYKQAGLFLTPSLEPCRAAAARAGGLYSMVHLLWVTGLYQGSSQLGSCIVNLNKSEC